MAKTNECYAYLRIDGPFDPQMITQRVGIDPTQGALEGSLIPGTKLRRKTSRWSLHSRLPRAAALENHATDVLDQLDANPEAFRSVCKEFGAFLELVGFFRDYYPGLVMESSLVERLASYHLTLDFDFYFLAKDE